MPDATPCAHPSKRGRFAMIPQWVYAQVTDGTTLRIYTHLAGEYCDTNRHCFPSEARLADELKYSISTIKRSLRTLRTIGAVKSTRSRKMGGHWGRNSYVLPMDDPRDPDMQDRSADPDVDLSDLQEEDISAGRNQGSPMTSRQGSPVTHREPDPLKQPEPSLEPKDLPPRSKDTPSAIAPPQLCWDGVKGTSFDQASDRQTENRLDEEGQDAERYAPPVQAGVQPSTPQDRTTEVAGGRAVGTRDSARPDDLAGWGDDLPDTDHDAHGKPLSPARRERAFYAAFPDCLDIAREERWQGIVDELCGGLEPHEEHARNSMLDRGEHYRKIANTILKQREFGYCCGV